MATEGHDYAGLAHEPVKVFASNRARFEVYREGEMTGALDLAKRAIEQSERILEAYDRLAEKLAEQTLLNEELRERVAWYRRLLLNRGFADDQLAVLEGMEKLHKDHRFNGESFGKHTPESERERQQRVAGQ